MVIEHENTTVLIRKNNNNILKNLYISYTTMYKDHLQLAALQLH